MKNIWFVLILLSSMGRLLSQSNPNVNQDINYNPNAKVDTSKRSINAEVIGKIGTANILIKYHSPGVRGRTIWGGLVPYGKIWVTGAHTATSIESDKDFMISRIKVPKGKYALFTIPQKGKWIVLLNKNPNQHQADDYKETEDVIRIKVKPEHTQDVLERLQYYIVNKNRNKSTISMGWEKIKIHFDITSKE